MPDGDYRERGAARRAARAARADATRRSSASASSSARSSRRSARCPSSISRTCRRPRIRSTSSTSSPRTSRGRALARGRARERARPGGRLLRGAAGMNARPRALAASGIRPVPARARSAGRARTCDAGRLAAAPAMSVAAAEPLRSTGTRSMIDTLRLTAEEANGLLERERGLEPRSSTTPTSRRSTSATASCTASCARATEPSGERIPIALKDVIGTKGVETTAGSKILAGYVPVYDSTVAARCKAAGLSPARQDEHRRVRDGLVDRELGVRPVAQPVGSRRASRAARAAARRRRSSAGLAPWALGSDTGGSIKQPSALCGNVGLRPTYGTVSRYGIVAFASSLDQVGPVAKTVRDCALLYSIIAGRRSVRLDDGRGARRSSSPSART